MYELMIIVFVIGYLCITIEHQIKIDKAAIALITGILCWTIYVTGKNDIVTPPEVANEFNKLLPNSKLFWIKKCGHAPMMEHPKEFNNIVEKWFAEKNF